MKLPCRAAMKTESGPLLFRPAWRRIKPVLTSPPIVIQAMTATPLEPSIQAIGRALYERARAHPPGFYAAHRRMLKRAVADDRLRDALFQFIDVLPQLRDPQQIAAH